jgi:hypothetical protein
MKIVRKVRGLVGMIGLGLPEVEIPKVTEETEVEFHQQVVMLLVEETRVIPTPLLIVITPTPHLSIRAKSLVVVRTTGMRQGRQSMING